MNAKLKEAMDAIAQLPEDEQEESAEAILLELRTRGLWDASFEKSQDLLTKLSDEAMEEYRAGKTEPLEDLL
jgi:hypothetical protein